jgi:hypothetical protein
MLSPAGLTAQIIVSPIGCVYLGLAAGCVGMFVGVDDRLHGLGHCLQGQNTVSDQDARIVYGRLSGPMQADHDRYEGGY